MVKQLNTDQLTLVKRAFRVYDPSKSGSIKRLHLEPLILDIQAFQVGILEDCPLDAAPFDDVDTIKMDEFLNWVNQYHQYIPPEPRYPDRFKQPNFWQYTNRRQEHPLFPTTTGQLGRLDPTLADMPPLWTGKQGVFTQTFAGGMQRDTSLNCSVWKSRVHNTLDQYAPGH